MPASTAPGTTTRPARPAGRVRPRVRLTATHQDAPQQTRSPRRLPVAPAFPARSHIRMASIPTPDESFARLHRAGWSVGDVRLLTAEGPAWLVSGNNGHLEQRGSLLSLVSRLAG